MSCDIGSKLLRRPMEDPEPQGEAEKPAQKISERYEPRRAIPIAS